MDKPIPEVVRAVDHAVTVLIQRGHLGAADQLNKHRPTIYAAITAAQQPIREGVAWMKTTRQAGEKGVTESLVWLKDDEPGATYDPLYTAAQQQGQAVALRDAREYVVSELAAERDNFAGYEHCSNIASIEADLAKIDAALEQETTNG